MKKDEKLKMLETSVKWLRDESIALASSIEALKANNRSLVVQLRTSQEDTRSLEEKIKTIKNYNIILKNTIIKLKSTEYMDKYVKVGRDMALRDKVPCCEM